MNKNLFKFHLTAVCFLIAVIGNSQETRKIVDDALVDKAIKPDTSKKGPWKIGGALTMNLNQQNSSYWVGANEKYALTVGFGADLYANNQKGKHTWDNTLKLNYAYLNNQSQGVRKTADFIDLFSKYGRQLGESEKLVFATIGNLRTQFTNGYDYTQSPRRRTSGFFAPATALLTPGLEWRPFKGFSAFISPAAGRWVIVSNDPFSYAFPNGIRPDGSREKPIAELYGVDPARKVSSQFGAFASFNLNRDLFKNVSYTSRLDLYSNYLNKPQNIDMFWTNSLLFKVNKWLAISYLWNLAYDDEFRPEGLKGPRMQFLGNFGIGVSGKL